MRDQKSQYRWVVSRAKFEAVIFDLDGVITQSTKAHAVAWKEMFDAYLSQRGKRMGKRYEPFNKQDDYKVYIDGKPRYEGVKSFLQARGIELPYGSPQDADYEETICGLGNWKNRLFGKYLQEEGIEVYETSVVLLSKLRATGFKVAVVSSSKNCSQMIQRVDIGHLFDIQVDGIMTEKLSFKGKPDPDAFLYAARLLEVKPEKAVVVEDALAGVEAGKRGHFGYVIGVNRGGSEEDLKQAGADVVVSDLREIGVS